MNAQLSPQEWQMLSAYLDGQLSPREHSQVEQNLRVQPTWQQSLDSLNRTRMLLRAAPRRRAPRSFMLTPAMLPARRRAWWSPALSFTSALSSLMLIITLGLEFLPGLKLAQQTAQPVAMNAPAPTFGAVQEAYKSAAPQNDASAPAPIIIWGQTNPTAGGMGGGSAEPQPTVAPPQGMDLYQPTPTPTPQSAKAVPPQATQAPIQGSGPILGVQPTDNGQRNAASAPTVESVPTAALAPPMDEEDHTSAMRTIQIGLALLALSAGLCAWWLRR